MKEKILMVLCALFGLGMIVFGLNKFFNFIPMTPPAEMQAVFDAFGTIKWLMPLVGIVEIIGGVLIAMPKTRALGAIVILPVMVGIVVNNLTFFDAKGLPITALFALINGWAIMDNKNKYLNLIK